MVALKRLPKPPGELVDAMEVFLAGNICAPDVAQSFGWLRLLLVRVGRRLGVSGCSIGCVGKKEADLIDGLARCCALLLPDAAEVHNVLREEVAKLDADKDRILVGGVVPPPDFTPVKRATNNEEDDMESPIPKRPEFTPARHSRHSHNEPSVTMTQLEAILSRFAHAASVGSASSEGVSAAQMELLLEKVSQQRSQPTTTQQALPPEVSEALRRSAEKGQTLVDSWGPVSVCVELGIPEEETAVLRAMPQYRARKTDTDFSTFIGAMVKLTRWTARSTTMQWSEIRRDMCERMNTSKRTLTLSEASIGQLLMKEIAKNPLLHTICLVFEVMILDDKERAVVRRARLGRGAEHLGELAEFPNVVVEWGVNKDTSAAQVPKNRGDRRSRGPYDPRNKKP